MAAAGVLVVAGGVGYVVAQTSSPSPSSSAGSSAAAAPSVAAGPDHASAPDAITPAPGQGGSVQFTVRRSGTRYRRDTFAAQAAAVLAQPSAGLLRPGKVSGLARQHQAPALTGCVRTVAGAGTVRLVDQARYQGRPATIIVVARPSSTLGHGLRGRTAVRTGRSRHPGPETTARRWLNRRGRVPRDLDPHVGNMRALGSVDGVASSAKGKQT